MQLHPRNNAREMKNIVEKEKFIRIEGDKNEEIQVNLTMNYVC